jgi:HAD superfamily hydrolase (TIGR01490 family)
MAIVFFDLDGTLVKGLSQIHLLFYLLRMREISLGTFLKISLRFLVYRAGIIRTPDRVMQYAIHSIAAGRRISDMSKILQRFYMEDLQGRLKTKIVEICTMHRLKGDTIVLVTNALEPLAQVVARHLSIPEVIATRLEIEGEIYTGKIDGPLVYGREKVKSIKARYAPDALRTSYAYADHPSDVHLFKAVGHPVLVNANRTGLMYLKNRKEMIGLKLFVFVLRLLGRFG